MEKTKTRGIHFAWIVLIGICIFMGLARGGLNSAGGLFMVPVTADLGFGVGEFMLYFSISSVVTFIFLPIAGKLMAKYDIRLLLVMALVFQAGAFALFGFMSSIWGWYLLSIPMSMGSVLATQMAGPVLIGNWFKKHNGMAIGIMMAAAGLFGAILQPMAGNLITSQGWRNAYIILGVLVMVIGIPAVILTIRMTPQQKGLQPLGAEDANAENPAAAAALRGVTAKHARKSTAFYALVLFMFFITAVAAFGQHIPKYANQLGYDTAFAGGTMGLWMVGMLVGALACGLLSDKIGLKVTTIFAIAVGIVSVLMAIFMGAQPSLFNVAFALHGFMAASVGTLGPLLTTDIFGQKEYSMIYSTVAMGMAFASIVVLPGYGFIYDALGSYIPVLWILCALLVISMACVFVAYAGKKKLEQNGLWS